MNTLDGVDPPDIDALVATPLESTALDQLRPYGTVRSVSTDEILYRAGDEDPSFFVILSGACDVVRHGPEGDVVIVAFGEGCFLGELNLLTGQRAVMTARVSQPGEVLVIEPREFSQVMASLPTIADQIFLTLAARREMLRHGDGAGGMRILGSKFSPESLALRAYATHTHLAHEWIDVDELVKPSPLLTTYSLTTADIPTVILQTVVLRRPTPGELAAELGLTYRATPGFVFDLVVVGTGPAGLAASVYGASEGLTTLSLDAVGTGGQAATSSRIENYAGFPTGISGDELASRTAMQAQRLGARLNSPCEVIALEDQHGFFALELADGSEVPTRAVIVATGARYRRLPIEDLARFEGAGVYYAATDLETRLCAGEDVLVVGGGNSAGQAALHLAQQGSRVSIAIRRDTVAATMSEYLVRRIEASAGIDLLPNTEVREVLGNSHLSNVIVEDTTNRTRRSIPCAGMFSFIGAEPATTWLRGRIADDVVEKYQQ